MEQSNELNQNQEAVQVDTLPKARDNSGVGVSDHIPQIAESSVLNKTETSSEEKNIQSYMEEISKLKEEVSKMTEVVKGLSHHDLGSGRINASQSLDRTKTLKQHLDDHFKGR